MVHIQRLTQRNIDIFNRHTAGETQKNLAREYGITPGRVSAIYLLMYARNIEGRNSIWTPVLQFDEIACMRDRWIEF